MMMKSSSSSSPSVPNVLEQHTINYNNNNNTHHRKYHPSENEIITNHVEVQQCWVERANHFGKLYCEHISNEDVEKSFSESDFDNFDDFIYCNGLYHIRDETYVRVQSKLNTFSESDIEQIYQKNLASQPGIGTVEEFIQQMEFRRGKNKTFYLVKPDFSVCKLFETISNIPWSKLATYRDDFIDYLIFFCNNIF